MYYNLKIITKDSELGLESNDKYIIAREMDIYFAKIFGASDEFQSKLKKVEINNSKLRSIDEVGNLSNSAAKKTDVIKEQYEKTVSKIPQQYIILSQNKNSHVEPISKIAIRPNNEELPKKQDNPQPALNIHNDFQQQDISENISRSINDIFFNDNSQNVESNTTIESISNEHHNHQPNEELEQFNTNEDQLEAEAQQLFEELQTQVKQEAQNSSQEIPQNVNIDNETQDIEINTNSVNDEKSNSESEQKTNVQQNNTQNSSPYQDIIDAYNEQKAKTQSKVEEIFGTNSSLNLNSDPLVLDSDSTIQIENLPLENDNQNANHMQEEGAEIKQSMYDIVDESKVSERIPNLSFSMFLSGFATSELIDEFIICAFYIKNILHQQDFTMKYINSKLFQATGKIADSSVVDELIQKEYISVIESDDFTKYAIAPKGEEYLVSKLQG